VFANWRTPGSDWAVLFLGRLADEVAPESLQPEVRTALVDDWARSLTHRIDRAMIDALDAESLARFHRMLDADHLDTAAIHEFLQRHVDDLPAVVDAVLAEFRRQYVRETT
jgi:hypothetical protein